MVYEVIVKECWLVARPPTDPQIVQAARTDDLLTEDLSNAPLPIVEEVDAWAFL
jgi:hypothetical protein